MCFSNYVVIHVRSQQSSYVAKVINVDHALSLVHTIKIYNILNILFSFFFFGLELFRKTCVSKREMKEHGMLSTTHIAYQFTFMTISQWMLCVNQKLVPRRTTRRLRSNQHCTINAGGMNTIKHSQQWTNTTEILSTPMVPVSDSISLWRLHTHVQSLRRRLPQLRNEIPPTFTTH